MINLDYITSENNEEDNEKQPYITDHPYRILIIGGSKTENTNTLLHVIREQDDIDKIYLYAKDLNEPKFNFLIRKHKNVGIKHCNNSNAFIEYSNTMSNDYNPNRKKKLIVFDDMIPDIMENKNIQAIIKELFVRCRKLNIALLFITQSYFSVQKDVRLNSTHYLIMKVNNRKVLQNIAINYSADIDYKDFLKIYRECIKEPYSFLTIDTALPASNSLRFRKNLFDSYKNDSN